MLPVMITISSFEFQNIFKKISISESMKYDIIMSY